MLYLSSYMKSQQSDGKSNPLTLQIDNQHASDHPHHHLHHHSSHLTSSSSSKCNNNNIYNSPVHTNSDQHVYSNLPVSKGKTSDLPPHLRYEQQLLSPIASSGNTVAGSVTGAIDSDYDLPPEERHILSLSHSPSPAYQPQLNQLNRLNYYQQQQQQQRGEQPKLQPAPVTRGPRSDLSYNKKGVTQLQSMNQTTLANYTEPTSQSRSAPKMAFCNQLYSQHSPAPQYVSSNNQRQATYDTYSRETTTPTSTQHKYFQSPSVRGKLTIGDTLQTATPVRVSKVDHRHPHHSTSINRSPVKSTGDTSGAKFSQQQQQAATAIKMSDREQKELDQLLSDMYQELATFPDYTGTVRSTARSVSTSNHNSSKHMIPSPLNTGDGKPFNRSISHSPSVRSKPHVSHYYPVRPEHTSVRDTVDSGSVYATLANTAPTGGAVNDSNSSVINSNCLPSSPSMYDHESRGMSIRSVTLTPTPVRPLYATQHSLVTSTPKRVVVTDAGTNFKGTHVLPGAKIGDQDAANRVGVYASTLGKKKLSSNERQELDDLINVMMEEVRHFPDYSGATRHLTSDNHSDRLGYHNGSISNLDEVGVEVIPTRGVAKTRDAFENAHRQSNNRSPSPVYSRSRQCNSRGERDKSYFAGGPTRRSSISPVRHVNRANSIVSSRSISTGRYNDRASIGTNATVVTQRAPSATSLLTASLNPPYGTAGGVLAQPSTEPLPPHLLTRPTEWCKDERSRPYHARADSRPFTYGVTSASPLIQRRRVHSESTAYVVENRPRAMPTVDYNEPRRVTNGHGNTHSNYTAGLTRGRVKSPNAKSGNIYDDPSELEREMDAISEVSYNSGETITARNRSAVDASTSPVSWLEKQQIKLKSKKDTDDTMFQEQKGKSRAMLSELTRTMSGSRVPGYDEVEETSPVPGRPPSPPKSRLIERLNFVNGNSGGNDNGYNENNTSSFLTNDYYNGVKSTSPNYMRSSSPSKGKSVTLLTEDGEIVDTEGRPATPGRPHSRQSSPPHHALTTFSSGPTPRVPSPTRYASYLHNSDNDQALRDKCIDLTDNNHSNDGANLSSTSQPSPIYASVNLIDKHRMATSQEDKHLN